MLSLLNTTFTSAVRGGARLVSKILSKLTSRADVIESEDCVKNALRSSASRKASFALIPSAYSDGEVHAALPDDGSGDLVFQRNTPAGSTRINSQGLVEEISLLDDELVTNGTFETMIGDELVTNGTLETILGNELVTNGGFDDGGSGWGAVGVNATYENGTAIFQNNSKIYQTNAATAGKKNKVVINFNEISGDGIRIYYGGNFAKVYSVQDIIDNGYKIEETIEFVGNENLYIYSYTSSTYAVIDNISVKEVIEGYIDETELVTNGGFDDESWWDAWGTWNAISSQCVMFSGEDADYLTKQNLLTTGKTYRLQFEYISGGGSSSFAQLYSENGTIKSFLNLDSNFVSYDFVANGNDLRIRGLATNGVDLKIDNISVKEVVQDNWELGTGVSINDLKAKFTDVSAGIGVSQNNILTIGKTYKISYEVIDEDYVSGSHAVKCGNTLSSIESGSGVFTYNLICTTNSNLSVQSRTNSSNFSIDNISVKEVTEGYLGDELVTNGGFDTDSDWDLGAGWSIENDRLIINTNDGEESTAQRNVLEIGKNYIITLDANIETGIIKLTSGSGSNFLMSPSSSSVSHEFTADQEHLTFRRNTTPTIGYLDNISVKEVVQDNWELDAGWSIADGVASCDGTTGYIKSLPANLEIGKTYQMTYSITDYTSGIVRIRCGGNDGTFRSALGTYTEVLDYLGSTFVSNLYSSSFIGSIDNISVKEVIEEGIPRLNYDNIEYQDVLGAELVSNGDFETGEIGSTNLNFFSETEDWFIYNSNIEVEQVSEINPQGGYGAVELTPTNINSSTRRAGSQSQTSIITPLNTYTFSSYIKSNGYNYVKVGGLFGNESCRVDLSTGTITSNESSVVSSNIENVGNGWYRVSVTYVFQDQIGNSKAYVGFGIYDNPTYSSYIGNGTSGILAWGWQLEELPYATSYIKTEGSIQTRVNTTDWNISTGWRIEDGVLLGENVSTQFVTQSLNFVSGKKYKVSLDVTGADTLISNSSFRLPYDGAVSNISFIQKDALDGNFTYEFTSLGSTVLYLGYIDSGNFTGSIDNISVKEVLGQEVASSGCPSLLLEPQSTNLIEYSEGFSDASWVSFDSISLDTGYLAPDGTNTATKVTGVIGSSGFYTAKTSGHHSIYARTVSGTGQVHLLDRFNNTDSLKTLTEEWQRFDKNIETIAYAVDFRGSSTLSEVIIWGSQVEALPYATSYIPTSGGIATRSAETLESGDISHLINSEEGVLYFEGSILDTSYIFLRDLSLTSTFAGVNFYKTIIQTEVNVGGVGNSKINHSGSFDEDYKIALAYTSSEMSLYVNGSFIETKAIPQIPLSSLDELYISYKGSIKDLRIYKSIAEAQKDLTYIN